MIKRTPYKALAGYGGVMYERHRTFRSFQYTTFYIIGKNVSMHIILSSRLQVVLKKLLALSLVVDHNCFFYVVRILL